MTVKLVVACRSGLPSPATFTVMKLVLRACSRVGVQRNTPLSGLIVALVGAPASKEYPRLAMGAALGSLAILLTTNMVSTSAIISGTDANVGGSLTVSEASRLVA